MSTLIDQLDQSQRTVRRKWRGEEAPEDARVRSLLKLRGLHSDLDRRNRELRGAYNELRELQNQLVQAEKMSSLGQLIAGLAHEINNAINAVYNGIKPMASNMRRLEQTVSEALAAPNGTVDTPAVAQNVDATFKKLFSLAQVIETGAARTVFRANSIALTMPECPHPLMSTRPSLVSTTIDVSSGTLSSTRPSGAWTRPIDPSRGLPKLRSEWTRGTGPSIVTPGIMATAPSCSMKTPPVASYAALCGRSPLPSRPPARRSRRSRPPSRRRRRATPCW